MRPGIVFKYIGVVMLLEAAFLLVCAMVDLAAMIGLVEGAWAASGIASDIASGSVAASNTTSGIASAAGGLANGAAAGSFRALILSAAIAGAIGALPTLLVRRQEHISNKEGYCIVVGAWLASCVVGMLPYLFWGGEFSVLDAWFESVSGFTTTGSSAIADVEALPRGMLFWRSCTHWIGGAGVVMFAMLVMPILGRSRMMVSSVEMSSVARDDYKYTSGKVLRIILTVYLSLSAACVVMLVVAGMGWFDAVNHAMSIVATGGFSTRNLSLAHWNSPLVEGVTMFFMMVSGLHFGVIFATLTGRRNNLFRSEVVRYYLASLAVVALIVSVSSLAAGVYENFWQALRFGAFQTVSITTTTGLVAADHNLWGPLAMAVLSFASIQCACAGSTSGGLKSDRVWLAAKIVRQQIRQQQHPNAIIRIKLGGVTQEASTLGFVMLFIVTYFFLMGIGTAVIAAFGYDPVTAFSMSVSSLGNVGQGFGEIGGFGNFSTVAPGVRFVCTLLMLLGRLEIFGLLQLFLLKWWR
ncbi:MAG: TrkH family potassium uptake protein [Alistipes sp.]|jgi:trk system potassium uptake protein TrkH|nr:TrkH family potassium uptake protein [Alistipes sp.]